MRHAITSVSVSHHAKYAFPRVDLPNSLQQTPIKPGELSMDNRSNPAITEGFLATASVLCGLSRPLYRLLLIQTSFRVPWASSPTRHPYSALGVTKAVSRCRVSEAM